MGDTRAAMSPVATGSLIGQLRFGGWLSTIAIAFAIWCQAIFGLFIWPYYIGLTAR